MDFTPAIPQAFSLWAAAYTGKWGKKEETPEKKKEKTLGEDGGMEEARGRKRHRQRRTHKERWRRQEGGRRWGRKKT